MNPVNGLALGRIAIGLTALASPNLGARLFRVDLERNQQLPYMMRLFASREIALGAMTLVAKGSARRKLIGLGMAVDGADAFASYDSVRTGAISQTTGVFLTGPAIGAVVAGAVGLAIEH